ncbi:Solute carrier family 25 member 38 [Grifola frondosa]|uniref:Solute carrier family 25 member 38 n=1 Tax=Grifola frondosa TaxID=5627 RepID=A0A1C7M4Q0_GRIFR|nr:Solute carrier family 25 member 38 [Grifola frondosa]
MSNVSHHLLSGALSGFASSICLQPFDLLKTRMQQGDGALMIPRRASFMLHTTRDIVRTNGLSGLWRGTTPTLLRNVPGVALYFTGLNQARTFLATAPYFAPIRTPSRSGSVLPKLTSQGNLIAGAATRVTVGILLNPFSVLKARYESSLYTYNSLQLLLEPSYEEDPQNSSASDISSVTAHSSTGMGSAMAIHGVSAAFAGALATLATQPFDVIKTKMQVRTEDKYHGVLKTILTVCGQGRLSGFFDGATLRMSRKVLSSAIGWVVYEGVLMAIRD